MNSPSIRHLRLRGTISQLLPTTDAWGQPQPSPITVWSGYCSVTPARAHASFSDGAGVTDQTILEVFIRYPNVTVASGMLLNVSDGRTLRILSADDHDGTRRWLYIQALKESK